MAFGKHGEGQLGRSAEGEGGGTGKGQEAEAWHLSPGLIPNLLCANPQKDQTLVPTNISHLKVSENV